MNKLHVINSMNTLAVFFCLKRKFKRMFRDLIKPYQNNEAL